MHFKYVATGQDFHRTFLDHIGHPVARRIFCAIHSIKSANLFNVSPTGTFLAWCSDALHSASMDFAPHDARPIDALEVFLNDMRYINPRFTYLLTYIAMPPGTRSCSGTMSANNCLNSKISIISFRCSDVRRKTFLFFCKSFPP